LGGVELFPVEKASKWFELSNLATGLESNRKNIETNQVIQNRSNGDNVPAKTKPAMEAGLS